MVMVTPLANRSPAEQAALAAFSRALNTAMARQGLSQSDLARAIWGTTTDARGRDVARNRDRISHYVRGTQMPEAKTMAALATALGVEAADLNPALARPESRDGAPVEFAMQMVAGDGTPVVRLTVNKVLPLTVATQIAALIAGVHD